MSSLEVLQMQCSSKFSATTACCYNVTMLTSLFCIPCSTLRSQKHISYWVCHPNVFSTQACIYFFVLYLVSWYTHTAPIPISCCSLVLYVFTFSPHLLSLFQLWSNILFILALLPLIPHRHFSLPFMSLLVYIFFFFSWVDLFSRETWCPCLISWFSCSYFLLLSLTSHASWFLFLLNSVTLGAHAFLPPAVPFMLLPLIALTHFMYCRVCFSGLLSLLISSCFFSILLCSYA